MITPSECYAKAIDLLNTVDRGGLTGEAVLIVVNAAQVWATLARAPQGVLEQSIRQIERRGGVRVRVEGRRHEVYEMSLRQTTDGEMAVRLSDLHLLLDAVEVLA